MRGRGAAETALVAAATVVDLVVWGGDTGLRWGGHVAGYVVPLATVAVYAVLPTRWGRPRTVFAVQLVFASAGLVLPGFAPFVALLVALYALARRSTGWSPAVALVLCQVPFAVDSLNGAMAGEQETRLEAFAVALALWSATSFTVWGLARLAVRAERRAESLRSLEKLAATRAERLRLARELHDSVANAVTAMVLQAAGARAARPPADRAVDRVLADIEATGIGAMDELHRMLHLLRSGAAADQSDQPDESDEPGPLDTRTLAGPARAAGVRVDLVTSGDPLVLDRAHRLAVHRLVQETLANTVKHAGSGARAVVELDWQPSGVGIRVEDARRPALVPADQDGGHPGGTGGGTGGGDGRSWGCGYGLTGLRERFTELGGSFDGHGTRTGFLVTAWLPAGHPADTRPVAR